MCQDQEHVLEINFLTQRKMPYTCLYLTESSIMDLQISHYHPSIYPEKAHATNMKCLSCMWNLSLVTSNTRASNCGQGFDTHVCILTLFDCIHNLSDYSRGLSVS